MRTSLIRGLSLVVALAACAWFAVGIRQARSISEVTSLVGQERPLSPAQVRHANALLGAAGVLDPDVQVRLLRGELALRGGHQHRAERIFIATARKEPRNIEPWLWVARGAGSDKSAIRLAFDTIAQLMPSAPAAP